MKTFKYLVNGLEVEAKYDEEDIDKVYKPLLNHWYDLYKHLIKWILIVSCKR